MGVIVPPPPPRTSDGRPIGLDSRFRGDVDPYFAGAGDDEAQGRGKGAAFCTGWDADPGAPADKTVTFYFNDWVYISAGSVRWTGAEPLDTVDFKVYAPATPVVANPGAGNCNLVATGLGFNMIVPAAGDGSHDYSDPVPVPASGDTGYWTWDEPDEGKGTVSPGSPGASQYNLFDISLDLVQWVQQLQLIGNGVELLDPITKARKILPQWRFDVKVHTEGGHAPFHVAWHLNTARKKTT